jgi:hypothetical protein
VITTSHNLGNVLKVIGGAVKNCQLRLSILLSVYIHFMALLRAAQQGEAKVA